MINRDHTPPRHPLLRMRFGSELNPPLPGGTPPGTDKVEAEPAANDDAKPTRTTESPS